MVHAPTARAGETAVLLLAALLDRAGPARVGPLLVDHRFDSPQFLLEGRATDSNTVAARRLVLRRQRLHGPMPACAVDYDRFDAEIGPSTFSGAPIDWWLTSSNHHFEPPQSVLYRVWSGLLTLARRCARTLSGSPRLTPPCSGCWHRPR